MRPGNFFAEPETLTGLDLLFTSGFWHIILLIWSPVILIGVIYLIIKLYKRKKALGA